MKKKFKKEISYKVHTSKDPVDVALTKLLPICSRINHFQGYASPYLYRSARNILKNLIKHNQGC
jgi:hypothetical protein